MNIQGGKLGTVLLAILLLVGFLVLLMHVNGINAHKSLIKQSEIPEIFHLTDLPALPTSWPIEFIEKLDDGFTAPSVTIYYKNGVSLTLSRSELIYPKKHKEQISIGVHSVSLYKNKEEHVYVTKYNDLFYSFMFQPENKNKVEEFIKTLM